MIIVDSLIGWFLFWFEYDAYYLDQKIQGKIEENDWLYQEWLRLRYGQDRVLQLAERGVKMLEEERERDENYVYEMLQRKAKVVKYPLHELDSDEELTHDEKGRLRMLIHKLFRVPEEKDA
jgi:hypothetical protein